MKRASDLRQSLSKMDLDPGYFCKFVKDQFVRKFINENEIKSVLDIGCDTGYIAEFLRYDKNKCKYLGMDKFKNKNWRKLIDNKTSFHYTQDIIFTLKAEAEKHDCVLLLDVIEHMKNRAEGYELIEVASKLSNKYVLISTPNCMDGKINWPKYHKYEYAMIDIIGKMYRNGFRCIDKFGWSMSDEVYKHIIYLEEFLSILPYKILKVLTAINYPEKSRDVMMVFEKND